MFQEAGPMSREEKGNLRHSVPSARASKTSEMNQSLPTGFGRLLDHRTWPNTLSNSGQLFLQRAPSLHTLQTSIDFDMELSICCSGPLDLLAPRELPAFHPIYKNTTLADRSSLSSTRNRCGRPFRPPRSLGHHFFQGNGYEEAQRRGSRMVLPL